MKTFVRHAVALLALTAVCQGRLALAEDYYRVSGDGQSATLVGDQKAVEQGSPICNPCNLPPCCEEACAEGCGCGGRSGCCCDLGCDECPPIGIVGSVGFDSFKGISDFTLPSNFGVVTGVNAGAPMPGLSEYGFGWQTGISYGIYDFDGRIDGLHSASSQQQTFVTTGFFRKAHGDQRLSFGIVYDWMFNTDWGIVANDPTLGQWRGQVEYALSGCNAVGVWACQRDLGSVQQVDGFLVSDRAISQVNMFWHHKFECGSDSWIWFGIPDHGRYNGDGSLADWTFGVTLQAPITDRMALYANASYLHPSDAAGAAGAVEAGYDVSMGVAWYFGGSARSNKINGSCWTPYMGVANNSTFLVEQGFSGIAAPALAP